MQGMYKSSKKIIRVKEKCKKYGIKKKSERLSMEYNNDIKTRSLIPAW